MNDLNDKLTLVDLFAGCGGLSLGLEDAGFYPAYVNALNSDALEKHIKSCKTIQQMSPNLAYSKTSRTLILNDPTIICMFCHVQLGNNAHPRSFKMWPIRICISNYANSDSFILRYHFSAFLPWHGLAILESIVYGHVTAS